MLTAIVGINWGDEGKGRMVDLLSQDADVVVRYQGGNNAGHTVINERGKFVLNLVPSGILRPDVVNVMGGGMVVDIEHLTGEIKRLQEGGVVITPDNFKLSTRASICMPYHVQLDCLEEERLRDKKFGSTRKGIAPVYADKYLKKTLRMSDLLYTDTLKSKLVDLVEYKNIIVEGAYGAEPVDVDAIYNWLLKFGEFVAPFICDTGAYLYDCNKQGKSIMLEAQLGALRDIDFGIYPFTTSSNTISAYAPIGAGVPNLKIDETLGIIKAYSSCVGEGPFVCEAFDEIGTALREVGGEYGATTGRPRRVGGFDVPASRYGCIVQGATALALTKLDILSGLEQIPVCVGYEVNGEVRYDFPDNDLLNIAKPVIEYVPGWNCEISHCRTFDELPENAQKYVMYIQDAVKCPIQYVSIGADREQYIKMF